MLRILHLLGRSPDFQSERSASILIGQIGSGFRAGSRTLSKANAGGASLRRTLRHDADVVHAWDAATTAAAVLGGARRVIYTPSRFPSRRDAWWLATLLRSANAQVACFSAAQGQAYVQWGIPPAQVHVIPPAIVPDAAGGFPSDIESPARNRALRAALGLSPDDFVLHAPGESTRSAAHRDVVWAACIVGTLEPNCKLLLWGRGGEASSCGRLVDRSHQFGLLCVAEQRLGRRVEPEDLLSIADAIVLLPRGPTAILPIAMCVESGLPIFSTPAPFLAGVLKDARNAVVARRRSPRLLAQEILHWRQTAGMKRCLNRAEAGSFGAAAFLDRYRRLYRGTDSIVF